MVLLIDRTLPLSINDCAACLKTRTESNSLGFYPEKVNHFKRRARLKPKEKDSQKMVWLKTVFI